MSQNASIVNILALSVLAKTFGRLTFSRHPKQKLVYQFTIIGNNFQGCVDQMSVDKVT
jgi:hypothetical protein